MARAYASIVLKSPVETVWSLIRDFNGLPTWAPPVARSKIESGLDADVVGAVRSFYTRDGQHIRERLLMLDDARHSFTYNFEKPAFPVKNYVATVRLFPVTDGDTTFAEWESSFDEAPGDEGKYEKIISNEVFAANWKNLAAIIAKTKPQKPEGAMRWKGYQPNKVWTSRVIKAPVADVWAMMRDFAGMGAWHDEITKCEIPWINYVSGPRLWPVTADNSTFGVWTGDWTASPQDDLVLIPRIEQNVYQKAFATVEKNLKRARG